MSDDAEYTGDFKVGDRVCVVEDREDGSWEGAEGTIIQTTFNKGGMFAGPRNIEVMIPDDEDDGSLAESEEGRATLLREHEEGNIFTLDSDTFTFEACD